MSPEKKVRRMSKDSRLAIRFDAEDRQWLDEQARMLGIGAATLVIMMVRQARIGVAAPVQIPGTNRESAKAAERYVPRSASVPRETPAHPAAELPLSAEDDLAGVDGIRAEEMEIPPDEDFAPTIEDALRMAEVLESPRRTVVQPRARSYRPQAGLQPNYGPGSRTRAVGVNPQIGFGNVLGDGQGNVLRDNFGHLGFAGTRAR